jgi:hypothetical protein
MINTSGSLVVAGQVYRPDVASPRARCEGQMETARMSLLPAGQRAGQPWAGRARAAPSGDDEPCRESRQRNGGDGVHRDDVLTVWHRGVPGADLSLPACAHGANVGQPADLAAELEACTRAIPCDEPTGAAINVLLVISSLYHLVLVSAGAGLLAPH